MSTLKRAKTIKSKVAYKPADLVALASQSDKILRAISDHLDSLKGTLDGMHQGKAKKRENEDLGQFKKEKERLKH